MKHGGVIIYLLNGLRSKPLAWLNSLSIEYHCEVVGIELIDLNAIVVCVYRAPGGDFSIFLHAFGTMLERFYGRSKAVHIFGDFNVNLLQEDDRKQSFSSLATSFGFSFLINTPTRSVGNSSTLIDNCLTNMETECEARVIDCYMSDHLGIVTSTRIKSSTENRMVTTVYRPLRKEAIEQCITRLNSIDWKWMEGEDVNTVCNNFIRLLLSVINDCLPLKKRITHLKNENKKWYNSDLRKKRTEINELHKQRNYSQDSNDIFNITQSISRLRSEYRRMIMEAKQGYVSNLVSNSYNRSKTMWSVVNQARGKLNKHKTELKVPITPNEFNDYFINFLKIIGGSPAVTKHSKTYKCHEKVNSTLFLSPASQEEVSEAIDSLSNSTARDLFGLSNSLLKLLKPALLLPLEILLNVCFQRGKFPDQLKLTKVIPVYKKGNKNELSNYRPISIIPIISKPLEFI
jgi:hypothetical protein